MCTPKKEFLSKPERAELYNRQRMEKDKRFSDQIRAILLLDKGWSFDRIVEALFLDVTTIRRYLTTYREEGIDELLALNYVGKNCEL